MSIRCHWEFEGYPHPGCAEFSAPDVWECGEAAWYIVELYNAHHKGFVEAFGEPYKNNHIAVCLQHHEALLLDIKKDTEAGHYWADEIVNTITIIAPANKSDGFSTAVPQVDVDAA